MVVVWRVTTACNLGCAFCGFDRRLPWKRTAADPAQILSFGRILGEWGRIRKGTPMVSWMGGEPLLWPPLTALTKILHEECGLRISATTNGTPLADPDLRRHLLDHYAELTLSVDGVGSVHDALRQWPGGYRWLGRQISVLAEEKKSAGGGPKLRANVVLMRDTLDCLERLCHDLAAWGVEEITINQLGGKDRPEFFPDHCLRPEDANRLSELWPRLRDRLAGQGVHLCGAETYLARIRASASQVQCAVDDCMPASTFLFVNEAGWAAPCSFTVGACGVQVEEIASVAALTALPGRFARAIRAARPAVCGDCLSTQVFGKFGEA